MKKEGKITKKTPAVDTPPNKNAKKRVVDGEVTYSREDDVPSLQKTANKLK